MGWFNPIKGAYPSLQQISKTLPVAAGETGIVRGSAIYEDAGEWKLATASQDADATAYIHFALQAQDDLTAGMAGSLGQGPAGHWNGSAIVAGSARIAGLAVGQPFEFETDQFDIGEVYNAGTLLTVKAAGELKPHATGKNCVGQVTKTVTTRWVNNAVAVTGFRTGANVSVLTARTLWLPRLATS
jgi:hypothetical protein